MLKYFGETTNSTKSDTEFWAAIAGFVEKFGQAQKALVAVSAGRRRTGWPWAHAARSHALRMRSNQHLHAYGTC